MSKVNSNERRFVQDVNSCLKFYQGARIGEVALPCASVGDGYEGFEPRSGLQELFLIVGNGWVVETVNKVIQSEFFWPWEVRVVLSP
jgi:hypothetical protein